LKIFEFTVDVGFLTCVESEINLVQKARRNLRWDLKGWVSNVVRYNQNGLNIRNY